VEKSHSLANIATPCGMSPLDKEAASFALAKLQPSAPSAFKGFFDGAHWF
jgi:hypothetical protein